MSSGSEMPCNPLQIMKRIGGYLYVHPAHFFLAFLAIHFYNYKIKYGLLDNFEYIESESAVSLLDIHNVWFWILEKILGPYVSYVAAYFSGFALVFVSANIYLERFLEDDRKNIYYLMLLSPILFILISFIGNFDTFVLAAYLFFLSCRSNRLLSTICIFAMVLCHREVATIMLATHWILRRDINLGDVIAFAVAQILPFAIDHILLPKVFPNSEAVYDGREIYVLQDWRNLLAVVWAHKRDHIMMSFNWFWIPFLMRAEQETKILVIAAFLFAIAFLTSDYTRIFSLISFPLMLYITERLVAGGKGWAPPIPVQYIPILCLLQTQFD